jgi:calmodulin
VGGFFSKFYFFFTFIFFLFFCSSTVNDVDVNGDGEIDFNEFLEMMARRLGTESNQEEELRQAFRVFDKDGDGYITAVELKLVMKQLGEELSQEQLSDMMREADGNGDGKIDFGEFCKMMGAK